MRRLALALAASLLAAPTAFAADAYSLDPGHTQVRASWNHAGYSTQSLLFRQVGGDIKIDFENPSNTSLNITIPVAGIDTGVEAFDKHLASGDFFEAEKHPNATFVSTSVEKTGDATLKVSNLQIGFRQYGRLTPAVKGVSFEVHKGETVALVG